MPNSPRASRVLEAMAVSNQDHNSKSALPKEGSNMMVFAKSRQERRRGRAILSLPVVALIVAWSLPSLAFDLGGDDDRPSKKCPSGKAWSDKARKCVALKSGALTDEDLARAGRQLARNGHFNEAIAVLSPSPTRITPLS